MTLGRIGRAILASVAVLLFALVSPGGGRSSSSKAAPRSGNQDRHCVPVGGMLMTNFGAIDQFTTMGTATGDLRGAVSGTLLGAPSRAQAAHWCFVSSITG